MIKNKNHAFTLVEMMISIAIIMILTASAVPFFKGMSKNQELAQEVGKFYDTVTSMQIKSRSGITHNNQKVWWAVDPCANNDPHLYYYGPVTVNSTSGLFNWDIFYHSNKIVKTLSDNVKFSKGVCDSTGYPIAFERLSGNLYDSNKKPLNEATIQFCYVKNADDECSDLDADKKVTINQFGITKIEDE